MGHLDEGMMNEINAAIAVSFGLGEPPRSVDYDTAYLSESSGAVAAVDGNDGRRNAPTPTGRPPFASTEG